MKRSSRHAPRRSPLTTNTAKIQCRKIIHTCQSLSIGTLSIGHYAPMCLSPLLCVCRILGKIRLAGDLRPLSPRFGKQSAEFTSDTGGTEIVSTITSDLRFRLSIHLPPSNKTFTVRLLFKASKNFFSLVPSQNQHSSIIVGEYKTSFAQRRNQLTQSLFAPKRAFTHIGVLTQFFAKRLRQGMTDLLLHPTGSIPRVRPISPLCRISKFRS
mmetsp:Transcript_29446/g.54650  ORF Transcript_29446/g.54650 Transcript_29446/m.54650 type:complete len:212 (-) Transcript_29446:197-832(-)